MDQVVQNAFSLTMVKEIESRLATYSEHFNTYTMIGKEVYHTSQSTCQSIFKKQLFNTELVSMENLFIQSLTCFI